MSQVRGRTGIVLGALGLLAVAATAGGAARAWRKRPAEIASTRAAAAAIAAPAPDHGVIAIASSPAGASIFVNGELSPQTTPTMLTNVAFGVPFRVKLAASGFEPASQTVTLSGADPSSAISVVLEPLRKKL